MCRGPHPGAPRRRRRRLDHRGHRPNRPSPVGRGDRGLPHPCRPRRIREPGAHGPNVVTTDHPTHLTHGAFPCLTRASPGPRHRPPHLTSSSSGAVRPVSPSRTTCLAEDCASWCWTPGRRSDIPGAAAGTRAPVHPGRILLPARDAVPRSRRHLRHQGPGGRLPESYATKFELPVLLDAAVRRLTHDGRVFHLETSPGRCVPARSWSPPGRSSGRPSRRRPSSSPPRSCSCTAPSTCAPVTFRRAGLVVGAGNSGLQIAVEPRRHPGGARGRGAASRRWCRSARSGATCSGG